LGEILEILGKNAVLVHHVGEIHPIFTKRLVFYINIRKFGVNFRNTWQECCTTGSPISERPIYFEYLTVIIF
jgi:hypothetical protein